MSVASLDLTTLLSQPQVGNLAPGSGKQAIAEMKMF